MNTTVKKELGKVEHLFAELKGNRELQEKFISNPVAMMIEKTIFFPLSDKESAELNEAIRAAVKGNKTVIKFFSKSSAIADIIDAGVPPAAHTLEQDVADLIQAINDCLEAIDKILHPTPTPA